MRMGLMASCALALAHTACAAPTSALNAGLALDAAVSDYAHAQWGAHPVLATELGLHQGDARIDDVSASAYAADIARQHAALERLRTIDPVGLTAPQRDDRAILMAEIGGMLLDEEQVKSWRHNPDSYVKLATGAVYSLIARDFAPLPVRMRAAIARENAIPDLLATARKNLSDMPAVYIEIAQENAAGAASFT